MSPNLWGSHNWCRDHSIFQLWFLAAVSDSEPLEELDSSELVLGLSGAPSDWESLDDPEELDPEPDSEPESYWVKAFSRFLEFLADFLAFFFLLDFASLFVAAMSKFRICSIFLALFFPPLRQLFTFALKNLLSFLLRATLSLSSLIKLKSTSAFFGIFKFVLIAQNILFHDALYANIDQ